MKSVPNIVPATGVSRDYTHAFQTVEGYLRRVDKQQSSRIIRLARRAFLDRRIMRYNEYFDSEEYTDVVNDLNKEVVGKLEQLALEANALRDELKSFNSLPYHRLADLWWRLKSTINDSAV